MEEDKQMARELRAITSKIDVFMRVWIGEMALDVRGTYSVNMRSMWVKMRKLSASSSIFHRNFLEFIHSKVWKSFIRYFLGEQSHTDTNLSLGYRCVLSLAQ